MDPSRPRSSGYAAPRRVFTAPVPPSPAATAQSATGLVETLYDHPNVKIVSFTAGPRTLFVGARTAGGPDIEPGTLPWSTQLERTLAVGPFRIYRAPGSVAFLSCGSALQPILKKSQVWCVDEESSKFVLQVRRPQYWRIEVPVELPEDVRRAQQLRDVFDAILQFEKTECPFKRSFTVELPERPETPVTRRPWTPARRSSASLPLTPTTPVEIARLHEGTPRGSICIGDLRTASDTRRALREHSRRLEAAAEESAAKESEPVRTVPQHEERSSSVPSPLPVDESSSRTAAAPPQQASVIVTEPQVDQAEPLTVPAEARNFKSPTESAESFTRPQTWLPTPLPPSPPISAPGSPRSSSPQPQAEGVSETAITQPVTSGRTATPEPPRIPDVAAVEPPSEPAHSPATALPALNEPDCTPARASSPQPEQTIQRASTPTPVPESPETPFKTPPSHPAPASPSPSSSSTRRPPIRRATTTSSSISLSPSHRALSPLPPPANLLTRRRSTRSPSASPIRHASPSPSPAKSRTGDAGGILTRNTNPTSRPPPPPPPSTTTARAGGRPAVRPAPVPNPLALSVSTLTTAVRRLPLAVLHKTCEILLSPPSHLLNLMLKVAARITAGEWRGLVRGLGEGGERVSVAWDYGSDGYEDEDLGYGDDGDEVYEGYDASGGVGGGVGRRGRGREVGRGWAKGQGSGTKHGHEQGEGGDAAEPACACACEAVVESPRQRTPFGRDRGSGWAAGTGFDPGEGRYGDGDWWAGGRRREGGNGIKMAGAFPESDDEEEEEDVGPLDIPRSRSRSDGQTEKDTAGQGRSPTTGGLVPLGDDQELGRGFETGQTVE